MKLPNPKFGHFGKTTGKSYEQSLREAAEKNPKLYGDYVKKGHVEVWPKLWETLTPTGHGNFFNPIGSKAPRR